MNICKEEGLAYKETHDSSASPDLEDNMKYRKRYVAKIVEEWIGRYLFMIILQIFYAKKLHHRHTSDIMIHGIAPTPREKAITMVWENSARQRKLQAEKKMAIFFEFW